MITATVRYKLPPHIDRPASKPRYTKGREGGLTGQSSTKQSNLRFGPLAPCAAMIREQTMDCRPPGARS
jgi:hypothetical protein